MENNNIVIKARELIEGRGDGRISNNDVGILLNYDYDNIENIRALFYVYDNFNLTNSAKTVFINEIFKWSKLHTIIKKNVDFN